MMLSFKNIGVTIKKKRIVDGVSFSLRSHRITALIGKNGSGKTTLISCINGLARYTGEISYGDRNMALMPARERAQLVSVLPQILPAANVTVEELTAMGRIPYLDLGKHLTENDRARIEEALAATGMTQLRDRLLGTLSGGERQKAYISMILAQNTRMVIFDEPTTYMDIENQSEFVNIAKRLKAEHKKTVLTVMHDLTRVVDIADDVLILDKGKCVFFGDTKECVESGIIERVFGVKKSTYEDEGIEKTMYY